MAYKIQPYTFQRASKLGVQVRPSTMRGKKIDVYSRGKKVASVGAQGYGDYPTFLAMEKTGQVSRGHADARRRAYKARHNKNRKRKGSPGWFADQLLW